MTTRTYTRGASPASPDQLIAHILAETGKVVTIELTAVDALVTGSLTASDDTTIQASINSYVYAFQPGDLNVPINYVDDTSMSNANALKAPSQRAAYASDIAIAAIANSKTSVRFYLNGVAQNGTPVTGDIVEWVETQNTTAGSAVFNLTTDRTANGASICSSIFADSIQTQLVDSTNLYAQGVPVVTNNKSVSVPIKKQAFNGITLLSTNILGSVAMNAAPDGVVVKFRAVGIAA